MFKEFASPNSTVARDFCSKDLDGRLHKIVKTQVIFRTNNKHLTTKLVIKSFCYSMKMRLVRLSFPNLLQLWPKCKATSQYYSLSFM